MVEKLTVRIRQADGLALVSSTRRVQSVDCQYFARFSYGVLFEVIIQGQISFYKPSHIAFLEHRETAFYYYLVIIDSDSSDVQPYRL
jgi:hypothetical protein